MAKGDYKVFMWFISILLLAVVVGGGWWLFSGTPEQQTALTQQTGQAGTGDTGSNAVCTKLTAAPTLTFATSDAYQPGTALSTNDNFIAHRKVGQTAWTYTRSGASTSIYSGGDKIELAPAVNSTAFNGQYGYWVNGEFKNNPYVVPCDPASTVEFVLTQVASPSNFQVNLYNNDLVTKNAVAAGQSISSDVNKVMKFTFVGDTKKVYGSESAQTSGLTDEDGTICNGRILTFNVNKTAFDNILIDGGSSHTIPEQVNVGAGNKTIAYQLDALKSSNQQDVLFTVDVTASYGGFTKNGTWKQFDCHTYVNTLNSKVEVGTEKYTGDGDVGTSTASTGGLFFSD